ncbi:MAG: HD domain-containing phosphohydrolase [Campylobacterota bacterium]
MTDVKELKKLCQDLTVLYVEDDQSIRGVMAQYLEKFFLTVVSACDGIEGLEAFKNTQSDIVITDLSMPNMGGLEMLQHIKRINEDQAVLITTAHNEPEYMMGAIKSGVDGYIMKPFDFMQLNHELYKLTLRLKKFKENEEYKLYLKEMVEKKTSEIVHLMDVQKNNYDKTLYLMVDMIEQRDTYTAGHSKRVAEYSKLIAQEMGFPNEECELIYEAGILHDIGKIATPDAVLLNPKTLKDIEYKLIEEHVEISFQLLEDVPMFKSFSEIVHSHHERYDGTGYPKGLKGDEIAPLAHIMIVADAFDAMTTNRIYKSRKTVAEAIEEIAELSGKQFHPEVVSKAVTALKNVVIDENISQLPRTKLEQERFAYFYKDTLSEAYNQNYLDVVLLKNSFEIEYKYMEVFSIKNFSAYNREYGWEAGDIFLTEFTHILSENCKDSLLFRVFGDDFVLLSKDSFMLERVISLLDDLIGELDIQYTVQDVDLSSNNIDKVSDIEMLQVE